MKISIDKYNATVYNCIKDKGTAGNAPEGRISMYTQLLEILENGKIENEQQAFFLRRTRDSRNQKMEGEISESTCLDTDLQKSTGT